MRCFWELRATTPIRVSVIASSTNWIHDSFIMGLSSKGERDASPWRFFDNHWNLFFSCRMASRSSDKDGDSVHTASEVPLTPRTNSPDRRCSSSDTSKSTYSLTRRISSKHLCCDCLGLVAQQSCAAQPLLRAHDSNPVSRVPRTKEESWRHPRVDPCEGRGCLSLRSYQGRVGTVAMGADAPL